MLGSLRKRWFQVHSRFLGLQNQASDTGAVISSLSKTLRLCLQSLVLGLGALLVIKGDMTAGMMIAGSILMGRVLSPIDQLIAVWKQWSGAKLAYRRLDALLQAFPPVTTLWRCRRRKARSPSNKSAPVHRGNVRRPCRWSTSI